MGLAPVMHINPLSADHKLPSVSLRPRVLLPGEQSTPPHMIRREASYIGISFRRALHGPPLRSIAQPLGHLTAAT